MTIRDDQQGGCPPTPDGEEVGSRRREDVPTVLNYSRGSTAGLDEVREDSKAVKVLRAAKFEKSARSSCRARLKWWEDRCKIRGWNPRKVTPSKLEVAAALLKKGKYRSASLYLEAGGAWADPHRLVVADGTRAFERGQGPAKQADPLPLEAIAAKGPPPFIKEYWPAVGVDLLIVSCAWLLREIETAGVNLEDVTVNGQPGTGGCGAGAWAQLHLPVSKTDP